MVLPRIETIFSCPICLSADSKYWCEAQDLLTQSSKQIFEYSECADCSTLYMNKRPVEEDVSFFYSSGYHPYLLEAKESSFLGSLKIKLRKIARYVMPEGRLVRKLKLIYRPALTKKIFVDFGCGAGKHLDLMGSKGWSCIGVDFSHIALNAISQRGHRAYLVKNFFKEVPDASVDMVRMNHVVEHLYHPLEILAAISKKIKSGGCLHIAVPNPEGLSAKLFRNYWHGLDCPRHAIMMPSDTLANVLKKSEFSDFEIIQEPASKDFVRSMGYWTAKFGLIELPKVNSLMNSIILKLIFGFPMFIASNVGLGDRYHIVCRKK